MEETHIMHCGGKGEQGYGRVNASDGVHMKDLKLQAIIVKWVVVILRFRGYKVGAKCLAMSQLNRVSYVYR